MSNGGSNGGTRDYWKTAAVALATFLAGILIAGGGYVLRAPTRDEVDIIRERQNEVLQRLARIDVLLEDHDEHNRDFSLRLNALERLVNEILSTGS